MQNEACAILMKRLDSLSQNKSIGGARIYWADGVGISSTDNRGRTYSPRGITPAIKSAGTRFKCK